MARRRWVKKGAKKAKGWKKTGRTRRRKMKNPLGSGIPNSERLLRVDFDFQIPVTFTGTGAKQLFAYSFPLNFPGNYTNPSSTYGAISALGASTYSPVFYRLMGNPLVTNSTFDEYRVLRLIVTFQPAAVQVQTESAAFETIDSPNLLYRTNDMDDNVNLSNEGQALNNGARPYAWGQGKPLVMKFHQLKQDKGHFINTGNAFVAPGAAVTSSTLVPVDAYRSMKLLFVTSNPNAAVAYIGRLNIQWQVILRGITPIAN